MWLGVSLLAGVVLLIITALLGVRSLSYGKRAWFGALFALTLLCTGYAYTTVRHDLHQAKHWAKALAVDSLFQGVVEVTDMRPSGERMRVHARAQQWVTQDSTTAVHGQLYFYLPLTPQVDTWLPGTQIALQGTARRTRPAPNPHAFSFADYLARQNIYYQLRVDTASLEVVAAGQASWVGKVEQLRHWALDRLRTAVATPREYGVAAALLLGYRSDLDQEVRSAYAETGAVHILAVSGLHVGILAQLVTWILLWWPRRGRWAIVRLALLLLIIWSFAALTGLSASVTRAAVMFSLVAIGEFSLGRQNIYNSLAAAALLLLLYEPLWLFDIGFQLSFLAVIGIVYFQPVFDRAIYFSWRPARWLWSLLSVALAAQLTTFPLSVYYFHQFPLYFWLSGLVVPLVAPILLVGIGTILFGTLPVVGPVLSGLLSALLYVCNSVIFIIQALPGGLWTRLWPGPVEVLLYFGLIGVLAVFIRRRSAKVLLSGLCIAAVLLSVQAVIRFERAQQQALIIYHIPRTTVIDVINGPNRLTLSSLPDSSTTRIDWATANHRSYLQIASAQTHNLADSVYTDALAYRAGYGQWGNQRFRIIDVDWQMQPMPDTLAFLLLTQNTRVDLPALIAAWQPAVVVADGNNAPWRREQWASICDSLSVPYHDTNEQGAFLLNQ